MTESTQETSGRPPAGRPLPLVEVHGDAEALATAVAGELLSRIADLQASGQVPQIALTGGTIAYAVHREVARLADEAGVDWGAIDLWWGDERYVAGDSDERNAAQARAAFIDAVGVPGHRVHEVPATGAACSVEEAARAYAAELGERELDVLMLGVGPDGHIASLFPHSRQLDADGVTAAVSDSPKPPPARVSLTYAALNRAHVVWLVASGEGKAEAVAKALAEVDGDDALDAALSETPARGVRGSVETTFFLDAEAASRL